MHAVSINVVVEVSALRILAPKMATFAVAKSERRVDIASKVRESHRALLSLVFVSHLSTNFTNMQSTLGNHLALIITLNFCEHNLVIYFWRLKSHSLLLHFSNTDSSNRSDHFNALQIFFSSSQQWRRPVGRSKCVNTTPKTIVDRVNHWNMQNVLAAVAISVVRRT